MSTSVAVRPPVRAAFRALIDYAGLFPPAGLPMREAVAEYAAARHGAPAWMLGRFIVPVSRGPELLDALRERADEPPFALSAIVDAAPDPRRWFDALQARLQETAGLRASRAVVVEALEVPLPPLATMRETFDAPLGQLGASLERAGLRDLPAYAEAPRGPGWRERQSEIMAATGRARLGAKLRCGGVTAQAFPSVEEVAAFVAAATAAGVAFKATAGLHHPVRHVDAATGFAMHGFLNVLASAAFAADCVGDELVRVVAEEDPDAFWFDDAAFGWRERRIDAPGLEAIRARGFAAYGSCSFKEPVDDLVALGVLPGGGEG